MANINIDLVRGHIDTIILKSLSDSPKYGLQILEFIKDISNNMFSMKQPTLYTCLKRLEKLNYIESFQGDISKGAPRLYYKLTAKGVNFLIEDQNQWEFSRTILDKLLSDKTFDPKNDAMPFDPIDYRPLTKRNRKDKLSNILDNSIIDFDEDTANDDDFNNVEDTNIEVVCDYTEIQRSPISSTYDTASQPYGQSLDSETEYNIQQSNISFNQNDYNVFKNSLKYKNNYLDKNIYNSADTNKPSQENFAFTNNNRGTYIDSNSTSFDENIYNNADTNKPSQENFAFTNNNRGSYIDSNSTSFDENVTNNNFSANIRNENLSKNENDIYKTKNNGSFLNFSEKLLLHDYIAESKEDIVLKKDAELKEDSVIKTNETAYKILSQTIESSSVDNNILKDSNFSPDLKSSKKGVCLGKNEKDSMPKMNIIFDEKMFKESRQKQEYEEYLYRKSSNTPVIHNNGSFLDDSTRAILPKEIIKIDNENSTNVTKIDYKNNGEFLNDANKRYLTDYIFTPEKKEENRKHKSETVDSIKKKNDGQYINFIQSDSKIDSANFFTITNTSDNKNNDSSFSASKPSSFGHSFVSNGTTENKNIVVSGQEALNKHIFSVQSKNSSQYITKDRFFNINDNKIDNEISKKAVSTTFPSMGHNKNYKVENEYNAANNFYSGKLQDYVLKNKEKESTEIKSFKKISLFKRIKNYFNDRKARKVDFVSESSKLINSKNTKNEKISKLLHLDNTNAHYYKEQTLTDIIYENKLNNIIVKKQTINTNQSAFGSKKYYSNIILLFTAFIMSIVTSIEVIVVHFLAVGKFSNNKIMFLCLISIFTMFILIVIKYMFYPNKTYFSKIQWSTPIFAVIISIINTILICMIIAFVHIKIETNDLYQMMRYIYMPILFSLNFPFALFIYYILYKSKKFHYISWRKK